MAFIEFTVIGDYQGFAPGSVVKGTVIFATNLPSGTVVKTDDDIGLVPVVFTAFIRNGILLDAVGQTVSLYANDPAFNLTGDLQYTVSFDGVTASGQAASMAGFTFTAPVDSTQIDLVEITPDVPLSVIQTAQISDISGLQAALNTKVSGTGITNIVAITQTAYNALSPPVATTLYVITGP